MISQYDIGTIVMLNNLEEGKQVKIMSFFFKAYSNTLHSVFETKCAKYA